MQASGGGGPVRFEHTEQAIAADEYDSAAWKTLWSEAQRLSIAESRDYYERFLKVFPTAAKYWRLYVQHELKNKNFAQVQALLNRCLLPCASVPLYQDYLQFMVEQKKGTPTFRAEMMEVYKFAVDQVGMDFESIDIWRDYIEFIKEGPAMTFHEENQKLLDVRKAYQSATKSPKRGIEALWRDYTDFENAANANIAKKVIGEFSKTYNKARQITRPLELKLQTLSDSMLARPPRGDPVEAEQLQRWLEYIDWEKSNPMGYDGLEAGYLVKRVHNAYKQCLVVLRHYERIWIDHATFLSESAAEAQQRGDSNAGIQLEADVIETYKEACKFLPQSTILGLAHADHLESQGKPTEAQAVYEQMLKRIQVGQDNDGSNLTLVYIQYMRSMRRANGTKGMRDVFKIARQDTRCSHHVFVAAALMELSSAGKPETVCINVFELGIKKGGFGSDAGYAKAFLDHLCHLTNQENTRDVFQRLLADMPTDQAEDIWRMFHAFECSYGTLQAVMDVERKLASLYPATLDNQPAKHLVGRFKFMDLMPATPAALATMGVDMVKESGGAGLADTTAPGDAASGGGGGGKGASAAVGDASDGTAAGDGSEQLHLYGPDLRMHGPFKPQRESPPGVVYRSMVLDLLKQLPPPDQFRADAGFVVKVDVLLKELAKRDIPEPSTAPELNAGSWIGGGGGEGAGRNAKRSLNDAGEGDGHHAQRMKLEH
eukprot:m.8376 g.8376  ORF g.8376 m.8376 type:complete len:714 (+) comp2529_c0_seq1:271-2412(+)